jgi:predicted acetyltransferase
MVVRTVGSGWHGQFVTDISIDRIQVEDLPAWSRSVSTTFLDSPVARPEVLEWRAKHFEEGRFWGAKAGGRYVGSLRTFSTPFSVPGWDGDTVDVTADAVTSVTVAATHRRRGLLRSMISMSLDEARERGEPISILVAAEWPIYGRFGYAPASQWAEIKVATRSAGAQLRRRPTAGAVREVERAEMQEAAPDLFEVVRRQRAGNLRRDESDWERIFLPELRSKDEADPIYIVHEDDAGAVDGYVSWRTTEGFEFTRGGKIQASQITAANPTARAGLWDYLLNMDVVDEVTVSNGPVDDPLRWELVDGRVLRADVIDAVWVRLLDVPAAMSARGYAGPGTLAFELVDADTGGYAAGRYLLDAGTDGATCVRTETASPELRMSHRALAAVYLGDFSLRVQHEAGLVDELVPGAIARADAMLRTGLLPWPMTGF